MNKESIAVIGKKDSILAFKSVGCDIFGVEDENTTRKALNKAIAFYKVILITDDYAPLVEDIIKDTYLSAYPVVLVIPSGTEKSDYALKKISNSVEQALGVNILMNEEN